VHSLEIKRPVRKVVLDEIGASKKAIFLAIEGDEGYGLGMPLTYYESGALKEGGYAARVVVCSWCSGNTVIMGADQHRSIRRMDSRYRHNVPIAPLEMGLVPEGFELIINPLCAALVTR